jgi:hypothetical protein
MKLVEIRQWIIVPPRQRALFAQQSRTGCPSWRQECSGSSILREPIMGMPTNLRFAFTAADTTAILSDAVYRQLAVQLRP